MMIIADQRESEWSLGSPVDGAYVGDRFDERAAVAMKIDGSVADRKNVTGFGLRMAFASVFLFGTGTASTPGLSHVTPDTLRSAGTTSENLATPQRRRRYGSTPAAISEIRRRALLTFNDLAEIFKVSRRSVHNWASGERMKPQHEALLDELYDRIDDSEALTPASVRTEMVQHFGIGDEPTARARRPMINPGAILEANQTPFEGTPKVLRSRSRSRQRIS